MVKAADKWQRDRHISIRTSSWQVLKVVLFNIFINDVDEKMHRKAGKFVLNFSSYKNAKYRDNRPLASIWQTWQNAFNQLALNQLSRLTNDRLSLCKSYWLMHLECSNSRLLPEQTEYL